MTKKDQATTAEGLPDGWWRRGGWKESTPQPASQDKRLVRYFNPSCEGKHDRTTVNIMSCADCFSYTTKLEGDSRAKTE